MHARGNTRVCKLLTFRGVTFSCLSASRSLIFTPLMNSIISTLLVVWAWNTKIMKKNNRYTSTHIRIVIANNTHT